MRTHIISTIFNKEIKEILRDKRMLYLVILMPFFLYPTMFFVMGSVGASQQDKLNSEKVTVWVDPAAKDSPLSQVLSRDSSLVIEYKIFEKEELMATEKTIGIHLVPNFKAQLDAGGTTAIQVLVNESKDLLKYRKASVQTQIGMLNQQLTYARLAEKNLNPAFITPFEIETIDLSPQEGGSGMLVSMLPMLILLFVFTGCIYIAIDITAGEKERRTLQTLFTTTATTKEIIAGKFFAVISVGITSAAMNVISLFVAMNLQSYLLGGESGGMSLSLSTIGMIWFVVLILLSTIFLGALVLAVILLANSYKEAQSYVTPLMMVVLIPSFVVMTPGVELDMQTVFVPILNTSLAIVSLLKGDYDSTMLVVVALMSLIYGALALYLASLTFGNENVITGEKVGWKQLFKIG